MIADCKLKDTFNALLLSAAHQGDVISLEVHLSTVRNPNIYLNQAYDESEEQKCTLLMIACLNGYEDMVRMLFNSFKPDTEVLNNIKISVKNQNLNIYENVTAVWAAAALDNFAIVKLLVEHEAQVNHPTKTNSTPLRCACFHGNLNMSRYLIENGADVNISKVRKDTNLMQCVFREHLQLVTYLVDELKCDINECDNDGRSPLYLAVERGSFELVQFLLNRGARNFRAYHDQMSPLMCAAEKRRIDLVEIILPYCSLFERIETEELLGSAFACREHGLCDLEKLFEHLSRALELRSLHHFPKILTESTNEITNNRQECQTIDQLKECRSNSNNMYIEALLIRERLLGSSNGKYRNSLLHRGATLINFAQYQQGIVFWMYELDLHRQLSIPIDTKQLRYFVKSFAVIVCRWPSAPVQTLCKVLTIIMNELEHNTKEFDYNLYSLLFLITITSQHLAKIPIVDTDRKVFYRLVHSVNQRRYITRDYGSSLLHLSLSNSTLASDISIDRICKYPCLHTVRTLLQCGANVNASNSVRNTPLHVFVSNLHGYDESIFQLLCDAGAHLDCVNDFEETPMDVATNSYIKQILRVRMKLSLKCLCARLIQKKNIPFRGKIANSLVTFVERH